jgi:hypothetical protein
LTTLASDDRLRATLAAQGHDLFRRCFSLDAQARAVSALVTDAFG